MAEETAADTPDVAALKEQMAKANAEKDLAVAQLQKLQAEKNLAAAQAPPGAAAQAAAEVAAAKAEAEAQKALAEAQKAVFDQQKAAADAQAAAVTAEQTSLKAKFGAVAGSTAATGAVEIGEGGGNGEASLLAARAVQSAAEQIASAVKAKAKETRCIIYAGAQKPNVGRWRAFHMQMEIAKDSFARADEMKEQADATAKSEPALEALPGGVESVGAVVTGAGAILDIGAKLGSYFQSDYKVMGATIAGSDDDLLAVSVAGQLSGSWYPAKWMAQAGAQSVTDLLQPLAKLRDESISKLRLVQQGAEEFKAKAEAESDKKKKQTLGTIAAAYARAVDAYTAAQKRFDDLLVSLATVTDGVPLAVYVIDEKILSDAIDAGSLLLFVRLNAPLGGRYTKKNIWTFFGGMPFYVSGGVIASYTLVDAKRGDVKAAGQFTTHSGYGKVNEVAARFVQPARSPGGETDGGKANQQQK